MADFSFSILGESTLRRPGMKAPVPPRSTFASNLEKSLNLLDSSVAAAPSFRGFSGGNGGIGTPPHRRRVLGHPHGDGTFVDQSFALPTTPKLFKASVATALSGVESGNAALMLEESHDLAASTSVFSAFLDKMKDLRMEHQVFELLSGYEEICADQVSLLSRLTKKVKPGGSSDCLATLEHLENERATWQLVRLLYTDRLSIASTSADDSMDVTATSGISSSPKINVGEKEVADRLFDSDSEVRQVQIVIDWLEALEKEKMEDFYEKVEFFTDKAEAWENTLHSLQRTRGGANVPRGHVTELDPDASVRQNKSLADLDREDESRLQRYLFALVRSGQFDKAQNVCHHVGQSWKAATLEGWRLHHDPNFEALAPDGQPLPTEGNPLRRLWKSAAWMMADDDRVALYERALYAALTGNLITMLKVVDSWEDALWSYCRTLVDQRTEETLETQAMPFASLITQSLPPRYSEKELSIDQIFEEMEKINWNKKVSRPSKMQQVQSYIISGDIDGLLDVMHGWLTEDPLEDEDGNVGDDIDDSNRLTPHLIRFMAHLVLFLRSAGLCSAGDELGVALILKYVEVLIASKMTDLVATFTSHLPTTTQAEVYAAFLEGVSEDGERRRVLELGRDVGLDVRTITKMVVDNIRQQAEEEDGGLMGAASPIVEARQGDTHGILSLAETRMTPMDETRISSLDWLLYDPLQRAEALKATNTLCRALLLQRKVSAARDAFTKLPTNVLEEISDNWSSELGGIAAIDSLPPEDENAVREYFCIKAYLEAVASFDEWFQLFHRGKPEPPATLNFNATFTEKIAQEQALKAFDTEHARWERQLGEQSNETVERIYNVLIFVDGGWMVDARQPDEHDSISSQRLQQMSRLREQCLPSLTLLLHSLFSATHRHHDALHLADVIAGERHALYKVFRKKELQDFLHHLRKSSLSMLEQEGVDAFGFAV